MIYIRLLLADTDNGEKNGAVNAAFDGPTNAVAIKGVLQPRCLGNNLCIQKSAYQVS